MFCMKIQVRNSMWRQEAKKINFTHFFFFVPCLVFLQLSIFISVSKSENCPCHVFILHVCMFVVCSHEDVQPHVSVCTRVPACAYQLSSDFSLVCSLFYRDVISLWSGSLLIWLVQLPSLPLTPKDPVSWLPDFYVVMGDLSSDSRACMVSVLYPDRPPRPLCCFIYFEPESVVSAVSLSFRGNSEIAYRE